MKVSYIAAPGIIFLKKQAKTADRSVLSMSRGHCTEFTKMTGKDSGFIDKMTKRKRYFC